VDVIRAVGRGQIKASTLHDINTTGAHVALRSGSKTILLESDRSNNDFKIVTLG
jgi:hypothetical protein